MSIKIYVTKESFNDNIKQFAEANKGEIYVLKNTAEFAKIVSGINVNSKKCPASEKPNERIIVWNWISMNDKIGRQLSAVDDEYNNCIGNYNDEEIESLSAELMKCKMEKMNFD